MWDSHFRLGGAFGTDIDSFRCPASGSLDGDCMAASLLLHVTAQASGYFENCWVWTADHYLDDVSQLQINSVTGRGLLIDKSQGPNWFWGGAVDHSVLYQYNLAGASNTLFAHMQTETPYFQPQIPSVGVFPTNFNGDPDFGDCTSDVCLMAWALYITNSTNIFVYGGGFYNFFDTYDQGCVASETRQQNLIRTNFSQGIWLYGIFTKAGIYPVSPLGAVQSVRQKDVQNGYTTEISAWLALATTGGNLGGIVSSSGQPNPTNAGFDPLLKSACGNVPLGGTVVLTPGCITAINNLPDSSSANTGQKPGACPEQCGLLRKMTDTCCGVNGTIGIGVTFPPGETTPFTIPIVLPKGLVPPSPLPLPSADANGNPTTDPIPAGVPLPFPIIIPPGIFPLGGTVPLTIPPGSPLGDDNEFGSQFVLVVSDTDQGEVTPVAADTAAYNLYHDATSIEY